MSPGLSPVLTALTWRSVLRSATRSRSRSMPTSWRARVRAGRIRPRSWVTTPSRPTAANNSATATTMSCVTPICRSPRPFTDPVVAGTNLVYTITVTNNGPSVSSGFTVSDTLPVDVTFVSFAGVNAADCGHVAGVVTCTHTAAVRSATRSRSRDVDVVAGAGPELSNTASVVGDDAEPANERGQQQRHRDDRCRA